MQLFDELVQDGLTPTEVTFNSLLKVAATRADYYEHCGAIFERMRTEGYMPDQYTFATYLAAAGRIGDIEMAEKLFKEIQNPLYGFRWESVTPFNSLLNAYSKIARVARGSAEAKGRLERVEEIWKDLVQFQTHHLKKRLTIDEVTSYISTYAEHLRLNVTKLKFDELFSEKGLASHLKPDIIIYTVLLKMYTLAKRIDKAQEIWQLMKNEQAMRPDFKIDQRAYRWYLIALTRVSER